MKEGYFYKLDDYLALCKAPRDLIGLKAKIDYAKTELKEVVVQNEDGDYGIEMSAMPQGAAYKFARGTEGSIKVIGQTEFDDMSDAEEAHREACYSNDEAEEPSEKKQSARGGVSSSASTSCGDFIGAPRCARSLATTTSLPSTRPRSPEVDGGTSYL